MLTKNNIKIKTSFDNNSDFYFLVFFKSRKYFDMLKEDLPKNFSLEKIFSNIYKRIKNKKIIKLYVLLQLFFQLKKINLSEKFIFSLIENFFCSDFNKILKETFREEKKIHVKFNSESQWYLFSNIFNVKVSDFEIFKEKNIYSIEFINEILSLIDNDTVALIKNCDLCDLVKSMYQKENSIDAKNIIEYVKIFTDIEKTESLNNILYGNVFEINHFDCNNKINFENNNYLNNDYFLKKVRIKKSNSIYKFINLRNKKIDFFTFKDMDSKDFLDLKKQIENSDSVFLKIQNLNNINDDKYFSKTEKILELYEKQQIIEFNLILDTFVEENDILKIADIVFEKEMMFNIIIENKNILKNFKFLEKLIYSEKIQLIEFVINSSECLNLLKKINKNIKFCYREKFSKKFADKDNVNINDKIFYSLYLNKSNFKKFENILKIFMMDCLFPFNFSIILEKNNENCYKNIFKNINMLSLKYGEDLINSYNKYNFNIVHIKVLTDDEKIHYLANSLKNYFNINMIISELSFVKNYKKEILFL